MGFIRFGRVAAFVLGASMVIATSRSTPQLHADPPTGVADRQAKSDAIKSRLEKAKATFATASDDGKKAFLAAIGARITSATDAGDLAKVTSLKVAKISVESEGTLPDTVTDAIVIAARNRYVTSRKAAYATMVLGYRQAIRDFTRERMLDDADTTQAELDAQEKTVGAQLSSESQAGTNILDKMVIKGNAKLADGVVRLTRDGNIASPSKIKVPFRAEIVARTDSTDLRIGFDKGLVILNWRDIATELRFHSPADGGIHQFPGAGSVPRNQFVKIELVVYPDSATVSVNGTERGSIKGNFEGLESEVYVCTLPEHGSVVTVKSVIIGPPPPKK